MTEEEQADWTNLSQFQFIQYVDMTYSSTNEGYFDGVANEVALKGLTGTISALKFTLDQPSNNTQ